MAKKNFVAYGDAETLITEVQDHLSLRPKTWEGTQAEWDALTLAEKKSYDRADITDDSDSGDVDSVPTENSPNLVTSGGVYSALSTKANSADLGTAAGKDYTTNVSPNNHSLVESNAVYSAINNALSSVYTPRGSITCAELVSSLLIPANVGNVYNTTDSGTTTADFMQGAGVTINAGDSVGIIQTGPSIYKFNLMGNTLDLHEYQKKGLAQAVEGATTVEGALSALSENKQDSLTFDNAPTENSNNPVKSNGVYVANQNIYEVMGQNGAKNLLPTPYYTTKGGTTTSGALTATENADGSVTINGTAAGQSYIDLARNDKFLKAGTYILSGGLTSKQYVYINCLNNGTYVRTLVSATTSEAEFVLDYNGYDAITVGISIAYGESLDNVTFYPMIRLASDTNNTYQPYAKTNQQLTSNVTAIDNARIMYGVENILPNTLGSGTAATSVTYTRNSDGTISVSGTAVGNAILSVGTITGLTRVRLTGCPSGGGGGAYQIQPKDITDNTYPFVGDYGEGKNYTLDPTHKYRMDIVIREGYTISGTKLFKPMVVDLSAYSGTTYDDYVPYTKTNKQLTDDSVTWDNLSEVGAVNLLENKASDYVSSVSGLTFTVNDDKSVTVSATSGTYPFTVLSNTSVTINSDACDYLKDGNSYRLSGCPSGGSGSTYYLAIYQSGVVDKSDKGDGYVFTKTASMTSVLINISIRQNTVFESALTFYPMIAPVEYNGDYVPYAKTNRQLTNETDALMDNILQNGSINIYDIFNASVNVGNSGDSSKVVINAEDGTITFKAGTYAGYAEVRVSPHLTKYPYGIELNKKYTLMYKILSGTKPSNMSMRAEYSPADSWGNFVNLSYTQNTKMSFTSSPLPYYMIIAIRCIESAGGTLSNDITIKPLLVHTEQELLVDNITDYPLYAKTNRELTKVNVAEVNISIQTSELAQYRVRKCGKVVECTISLQVNEAVTAWADFATVPQGFRPSTYIQAVSNKTMYSGFAVVQIAPNGGIQSAVNLAVGDRVRFTAVWICP